MTQVFSCFTGWQITAPQQRVQGHPSLAAQHHQALLLATAFTPGWGKEPGGFWSQGNSDAHKILSLRRERAEHMSSRGSEELCTSCL